MISVVAAPLAGAAPAGRSSPGDSPTVDAAPAASTPVPGLKRGADRVAERDRRAVLGPRYATSTDVAWTTSGDGAGLHVLAARERDGYAWTTLATLAEPGVEADAWIGNACLTGDKSTIVATYAPRTATNSGDLFDRGGFVATVRLADGKVTKLPLTSTLAYFSPSCGAGATAVVTQFKDDGDGGATRVVRIDAKTGRVLPAIEVPGELTSVVPTTSGLVAADANAVVSLDARGQRRIIATGKATPFALTADRDGGVVFLDRAGDKAEVRRVAPAGGGFERQQAALVATGRLDRVGLAADGARRVYVTGTAQATAGRSPAAVTMLTSATTDVSVSTGGALVIDRVSVAGLPAADAGADPTQLERPVAISARVTATGKKISLVTTPAAGASVAEAEPHPALRAAKPDSAAAAPAAAQVAAGSPTNPVEAERYCSVPRNDPRNQVMQPKPRQVEWAVDQAVRGVLKTSRPANWKNLGMPAYTPQGLFPSIPLSGGGKVPAQVMLGVIAQESNMWQAPGSVVPGVTGNPLIGNYYGLAVYDTRTDNDWNIDFTKADCGYGVTQLTDGMRLAGRTKEGEVALPYNSQRAVALDFAANVAAGLRVLQAKWNETRAAGATINNGDPAKPENWFFAVWAYNSGFHPQSETVKNSGAWGLGWLNNPVNPKYPANRAAFRDVPGNEDARTPQKWPYPEKVMGWAAYPVEILESPGNLVAGFRPAWWTTAANRSTVKPPVTQFCDASNQCVPGAKYPPLASEVILEPAGPCAHRNAAGLYDLKCWYNKANTWKPDCAQSCGNELLRFVEGYEYQADGTAYAPNCTRTGLPAGALVIDDQPDATPIVRPGCARPVTNQGTFALSFAQDGQGNYPGKIDLHQLGAGFSGHFWYTHTRTADLRGGSMTITGTWTLNRTLNQWARVFVHIPDHGAHTQQARYEVDLGNGKKTRVLLQRIGTNKWVSLGSFKFAGTPKVRLLSTTYDGDDGGTPIENEDIAWDAVAFQPLAAKPKNIVVSLGDSYSAGEGGSGGGGADYYPETDNNGGNKAARNACHRSPYTWSRQGRIAGTTASIGALSDAYGPEVEHHLLACSGAETEHLLPFYIETGAKPANAWGENGGPSHSQFGELSQLDKGFLDENTTLVTLSVGGNDARFADVLEECIIKAGLVKCQDAKLDGSSEKAGVEVPALIKGKVEISIVTVLREIHRQAPNAKVLLMGYPKLFERGGQCIVGLGTEETPWLNEMSALLDTHMAAAVARANTAAGKTYAWFSNPTSAFAGMGVCGSPATIHGIVLDKTPGDDPALLAVSQQSFHPKIEGYVNYAVAMNATLRKMGL